MRAVGIDPGRKGALVLLDDNGDTDTLQMPLRDDGKTLNGASIAAWLLITEPDVVVVEKLGARNLFSDGKAVRKASNEFRLATGYGMLLGILEAMGIPYRLVLPMNWKTKVLGSYGTDKEAAIAWTQDNCPQVDLIPGRCRVPQDGIADAACLAAYGLQRGRIDP